MIIIAQIVLTSTWPFNKGEEVQKRYLEIQQEKGESSAVKSIKYYYSPCKKGMKCRAYHEVDQENLGEAMNFLVDFMTGFFVIDGYGYKIHMAASGEEMLAAQSS